MSIVSKNSVVTTAVTHSKTPLPCGSEQHRFRRFFIGNNEGRQLFLQKIEPNGSPANGFPREMLFTKIKPRKVRFRYVPVNSTWM